VNSAGDRFTGSPPWLLTRSLSAGVAAKRRISAFSRSTTGAGVLAGAMTAD